MIRQAYSTQSVHLKGFSPEQLFEAVRGARFEHYILSEGKCESRLEHWCMGDFGVDVGDYDFPVRVVGAFPKNRLCIGYMRRQSAPAWVNGLVADRTTVEFYPGGAELNYSAAPWGKWVAIGFEESSLQAAARERLGHEVELPWKHVTNFHLQEEERRDLDQMVNRLWDHPVSGTLMVAPILGAIAEILHAQSRRSSRAGAGMSKSEYREMLLRRSDEYLRSNLANPFQLEALAVASGTTARTLQRIFHEAYGLTPQKWARCLALHQARRHLQSPGVYGATVEDVARECGFRHMGRFAEYYRELFGELPSFAWKNGNDDAREDI